MQVDNAADPDAVQRETIDAAVDLSSITERAQLLPGSPHHEFRQLDARSIGLSRLANAIVFTVIDAVALVGGGVLLWVIPFPFQLVIPLVWIALAVLYAVSVGWWPRWEHDCWSYRVGDKVVELRYGVLWKVSVAIPLSRLQHVDLHRGPLERKWGLASLEIHTAGTRNASHRIPGLDVAVAKTLRDELIDAANRGAHGPTKD